MNLKEEIEKNINEIFKDLGLGDLSDEKKEELKEKIVDKLDRAILEATLDSLNDKQLDEFEEALEDEENTEALIAELTSNIPGLANRIDMALRSEWELIKKAISRKK